MYISYKPIVDIISEYVDGDIIIEKLEKIKGKIYWTELAKNHNAIHYLKRNPEHTTYSYNELQQNTRGIQIFEDKYDEYEKTIDRKHISYICLYGDDNLINKYVKTNMDKIDWINLSKNKSNVAFDLLMEYKDKINFHYLSMNENERAIKYLKKNIEKIDWCLLSTNKNAIDILEKNIDKISWVMLSSNENALNLLLKYKEKICNNVLIKNENLDIINKITIPYLETQENLCLSTTGMNCKLYNYLKEKKKIDLSVLCSNTNDDAIDYIIENIEDKNISWYSLSGNINFWDKYADRQFKKVFETIMF